MKKIKSAFCYFTKLEIALWFCSMLAIIISFLIFDKSNYFTLIASLIGVTSLILNAKGNFIGQILMIIFSIIYGYISYCFCYYGEMITYLGMTMPMAIISLVAWVKNPFKNKKTEVEINCITKKDVVVMIFLTIVVTIIFYFILKYFDTTNLLFSTLSVTTSFLAVYLTYKRSPFYAIFYALNDIVLIILWTYATFQNKSYISVVVCFVAFLFNDIYGFLNWNRLQKNQTNSI